MLSSSLCEILYKKYNYYSVIEITLGVVQGMHEKFFR